MRPRKAAGLAGLRIEEVHRLARAGLSSTWPVLACEAACAPAADACVLKAADVTDTCTLTLTELIIVRRSSRSWRGTTAKCSPPALASCRALAAGLCHAVPAIRELDDDGLREPGSVREAGSASGRAAATCRSIRESHMGLSQRIFDNVWGGKSPRHGRARRRSTGTARPTSP